MGNMRRKQGILGGKSAWGAAAVLLVLLGDNFGLELPRLAGGLLAGGAAPCAAC